MLHLLPAALLWATPAPSADVAALTLTPERSTITVTVSHDGSEGYRVRFRCIAVCKRQTLHEEAIGDIPLGLFGRDQDDLLFSLWAAGSVYRVVIWRVTDDRVVRVAELSSRGRPDFLSTAQGHAAVRTYQGDSGVGPWRPVLWTDRRRPHTRGLSAH